MTYGIAVTRSAAAEIASWGLPVHAENDLLTALDEGLTQEQLDRLPRVPAPGFVFIYQLAVEDAVILGVAHHFTFWLTYGPDPNRVYVQRCEYATDEAWAAGGDGEYSPDPDLPSEQEP